MNSNHKIFFNPFRVEIPRSDDEYQPGPLGAVCCSHYGWANCWEVPTHNDMEERSVFFWWGESKGSFFSSNFLWGEGEEHPVGSPRAVVFISDVEAMKICKEKITKFQVLFHKNSHDH